MQFEEKGSKSGQTIVFIHGGGIASWMWQKQWEAFEDYHVLLPDLPEHGKSAKEGPLTIEDSAQRIAELIQTHAHGGRAHVVGHSLGGKIAVQLLATQPQLVDHAVVASALFRPIPMMNLMLNMPAYRLTVALLRSNWVLQAQAKQFQFPNAYYQENFIREIKGQTAETLDRIYTQVNKHLALPAGLDRAAAPTLVIAGEREPAAMRLSVGDVARALSHGQGCLIQGSRHNFPWVQYEAFNAAIRAWITDQPIDHPSILRQ